MSTFSVSVLRLDDVEAHSNADRLELARVGGYLSVVPKDQYQKGDLVAYIPEAAIVPDWLLIQQGLIGLLAGSGKNRVKAKKIRGVLSQGIVIPVSNDSHGTITRPRINEEWLQSEWYVFQANEGDDIAEKLGVYKWEPHIPVSMAVLPEHLVFLPNKPLSYDIENLKRYSHVLPDHTMVVLTEKLHGTFMQVGFDESIEPSPDLFGYSDRVFICSKGQGGKGLVFKNCSATEQNLYVKAARENDIPHLIEDFARRYNHKRVIVMGEVFGDVQDLKYGCSAGVTRFMGFDIFIEDSGGNSRFVDAYRLPEVFFEIGLIPVPFVAGGPWGAVKAHLDTYTSGTSFIDRSQIREGVVIKPGIEQWAHGFGRVILKSVSPDYLLRKGETTELA